MFLENASEKHAIALEKPAITIATCPITGLRFELPKGFGAKGLAVSPFLEMPLGLNALSPSALNEAESRLAILALLWQRKLLAVKPESNFCKLHLTAPQSALATLISWLEALPKDYNFNALPRFTACEGTKNLNAYLSLVTSSWQESPEGELEELLYRLEEFGFNNKKNRAACLYRLAHEAKKLIKSREKKDKMQKVMAQIVAQNWQKVSAAQIQAMLNSAYNLAARLEKEPKRTAYEESLLTLTDYAGRYLVEAKKAKAESENILSLWL